MVQEEHIIDLIPAYALECLDEAETFQVEAHLAECEGCREELQAYREIVDVIPLAMSELEPPPGLKAKVLQRASEVKETAHAAQRENWWDRISQFLRQGAPAWGLVSLVFILVLGANNLLLWQRVSRLEQISQAQLLTVTLQGTETSPGASGLIVISMDGEHGTLVVDGLMSLDEAHQYQLWLINDGKRSDGGVFSVGKEGYGSLYVSSSEPLASYSAFGITIEPTGGSPGPTGEKVLGGEL